MINWADNNDKRVLAVSADKGWEDFAGNKENFHVIDDLAKAMNIFQSLLPVFIMEKIKLDLSSKLDGIIFSEIKNAIELSLEVINIDASSSYRYEIDDEYVELNDIQILKNDEDNGVRIYLVDSGADRITVNIPCEVFYDVGAVFNFFIWDSIDKENVYLGSVEKTVEENNIIDVLVSFYGNFDDESQDLEVADMDISVEVVDSSVNVDMGE
ncbi:hypothetical protein FHQ19_12065, partial [Pasteurellaceae bacterium UScroc12]